MDRKEEISTELIVEKRRSNREMDPFKILIKKYGENIEICGLSQNKL